MRELQNEHLRGEKTTFIDSKEKEEMGNEMNFEESEVNKERQEKTFKNLVDSTHIHKLPAKSFNKIDLAKRFNIQFKGYNSSSESQV